MTTPLHSTLKRALMIDGRDYVVTLTNATLKLTLKGKRNGVELPWNQLVNGEAALAVALNASVGAFTPKGTAAPANDDSAVAKDKAAVAEDKAAVSTGKTAPAKKLRPPTKLKQLTRSGARRRR
jgi:hypothetical protein